MTKPPSLRRRLAPMSGYVGCMGVTTGWVWSLVVVTSLLCAHGSKFPSGRVSFAKIRQDTDGLPWKLPPRTFIISNRIRGGSDTAQNEITASVVENDANSTTSSEAVESITVEEVVDIAVENDGNATIVEEVDETVVVVKDTVQEEQEQIMVVDKGPTYIFPGCKHGDGSESDPDGLPRRFLKMQKQNRHKAKKALNATMTWRAEHDVDTILATPHPLYDVCKAVVPHYFGGRDPTEHVIFIQRPGLLSLKLAHANNLTMEELLMHYVYALEYCWNINEPGHDQTMTSVIDLTGINFGTLRGEMLGFVKRFVQMMSSHYPSRSYKTLLLNTPRWFGAVYKLISPLLRESTKKKIEIHSHGKRQDKILKKYLGEANVPPELLSVKPKDSEEQQEEEAAIAGIGRDSQMERDLRAFCVARLDEAGVAMNPVIV